MNLENYFKDKLFDRWIYFNEIISYIQHAEQFTDIKKKLDSDIKPIEKLNLLYNFINNNYPDFYYKDMVSNNRLEKAIKNQFKNNLEKSIINK